MSRHSHTIERLIPPGRDADIRALALLLVDAVDSGAAVSFLAPLALERAEGWWRQVLSAASPGAIFLVARLEEAARQGGFRLLTLDAKRGGAAEQLYRSLGWVAAGSIPRYALDSDGTPHDTVIFYKELLATDASRAG